MEKNTSISVAGVKGEGILGNLEGLSKEILDEICGLTTAEEIVSKLGLCNGEKVLNEDGEVAFVSYTDNKSVPGAYKSGYNILGKGQIIPKHFHIKDFEIYIVVYGKVEINGKIYTSGDIAICRKGDSHYCMNMFNDESIVKFIKKM